MQPDESTEPTRRFSTRVDFYIRARPGYPDAVLTHLVTALGLSSTHVVADVGSGTGLLTELFLRHGNRVSAIEPNADMRRACEDRLLPRFPGLLTSIDGTAEATTLPGASVDFVVAGQAFHWFDPAGSRREFARILKPDGAVVLIWNDRRTDDPFSAAYQKIILDHSTDHEAVRQRSEASTSDTTMTAFFGADRWQKASFPNLQRFDFDGFRDRVLSSSYMPLPGHPGFDGMTTAIRAAFDRHQAGGFVVFHYDTVVYHGRS